MSDRLRPFFILGPNTPEILGIEDLLGLSEIPYACASRRGCGSRVTGKDAWIAPSDGPFGRPIRQVEQGDVSMSQGETMNEPDTGQDIGPNTDHAPAPARIAPVRISEEEIEAYGLQNARGLISRTGDDDDDQD